MKRHTKYLLAGVLACGSITFGAFEVDPTSQMVTQAIAQWPARPKLGAQVMLSKYGMPQEVTPEKLVWHNQGPYKRITVTKQEDYHDFPLPHTDFLEHTINYDVAPDKADSLAEYDGSCNFDRTRGELSARCDLEGHNILTLNLANDILNGKKSAEDARKSFGEIVVEDTLGKHPAYAEVLQFQPARMTAFADKPVIPGSPVRPDAPANMKTVKGSAGDGEVLGSIIAIDLNEVIAAMTAIQKQVNPQVAQYAKMMHEEHGLNAAQTMELGEKIHVTPLDTAAVDALRVKGAGELAAIVPLQGEQFASAYRDAMIKGHTEVLQMIDGDLLTRTTNPEIKQHLTKTRRQVAQHLAAAQQLQGGSAAGRPGAAVTGSEPQTRVNPANPRTK